MRYPKIATIKFKDKHVTVKFNVHMTMYKVKQYTCPKCGAFGELKDIVRSYSIWGNAHDKIKASELKYNSQLKAQVKKDDFGPEGTPYCPRCKGYDGMKGGELVETVEGDKNLYKLYVLMPAKAKYVNIIGILNAYTLLTWKESTYKSQRKMFTILPHMDRLIKNLVNEGTGVKPEFSITMEPKLPTEKDMEDVYESYQAERFAKRL